uniref:carbonic anhydrase n=1 Tax=Salmonella sp. SAL4457 TaxID=3159912 RepID=UPI00397C75CC
KLVVVLGHTKCGAVRAAVDMTARGENPAQSDLRHLGPVLGESHEVAAKHVGPDFAELPDESKQLVADQVARANALD